MYTGNRGPEAFYVAQDIVCQQLEKNHYPQFLVSDVYHNFIVSWDESESTSGDATSFGSNEGWFLGLLSIFKLFSNFRNVIFNLQFILMSSLPQLV